MKIGSCKVVVLKKMGGACCLRAAASSNHAFAAERKKPRPLKSGVHGGCAAVNRGADFVQLLVPSLRARTRSWTGHRAPYNQTAFACTAHGAGQHRD